MAMTEDRSEDNRPPFDEAYAKSLIGKSVLIGLTYYDHNDQFLEQQQVHGIIVSADQSKGFVVELRGERQGETFKLPPDVRPFSDAHPGEYRLRSTGEVVINPDLLATWIIRKPPPGGLPDKPAGSR